MKIKNLAFLAIVFTTIFTGCEDKGIDETSIVEKKAVVQSIPTFNLITSSNSKIQILAKENNTWDFKGYKGKAILIDFFATWCPPCRAEIPHLSNIRKELKNKIEIIGIDIGQRDGTLTPKGQLKDFIAKFDIKYPITTGGDNRELFGAVSDLNKRGSIPFMILFDTKGKYVTHYIGMVPEEMILSDIQKVLNEK
jgi:thiol-disulfide isomerase/thioredoxin